MVSYSEDGTDASDTTQSGLRPPATHPAQTTAKKRSSSLLSPTARQKNEKVPLQDKKRAQKAKKEAQKRAKVMQTHKVKQKSKKKPKVRQKVSGQKKKQK
jgi:hypothetical protein